MGVAAEFQTSYERESIAVPDSKEGLTVAVIGAGHWGKNIVRNMHALGVLAKVCESDDAQRAAIAGDYPDVDFVSDEAAVFDDRDISAVAIATPAATHGALVRRALEVGKDVFVEKPLCLDVKEAESLKELADRESRVLMVGHLLLYHPAFQALQQLVSSGGLGKLRYIYSNRASLGKIRREENALWSFAPHDISMILQLAGNMPARVVASGGHYLTKGVADTTLTHLDFGKGLQAHIFVSWLHPFKDHRMVVVGEDGMAVFNDVEQGENKLLLYRHKAHWEGDVPIVSRADSEPIPYSDAEPLRQECQTFLSAVRREGHPVSDAAEGIRVLAVLDACQASLQSGMPVELAIEHA